MGIAKGFINAHKASKGTLSNHIENEASRRLEICDSCDTLNQAIMWCSPFKGGCGCFVKKKVFDLDEKCPKQKW